MSNLGCCGFRNIDKAMTANQKDDLEHGLKWQLSIAKYEGKEGTLEDHAQKKFRLNANDISVNENPVRVFKLSQALDTLPGVTEHSDKHGTKMRFQNSETQSPRGIRKTGMTMSQSNRKWILLESKTKLASFVGSFDHVQAHCKITNKERMVYGNNYNKVNYNYTTKRTHPNAQRNMVPRAVLMKTGLKPFNTAKTVNTAHPKSIVFSAKAMSPVVNAVRVNQENAVKASACWVWRPTKLDSASITLKKHNYIDARAQIPKILFTFGERAHGGRISSKGTLKTDSLDFKDLPDESQILLKIPRKDNMYNFDMKNIVPKEILTCLVAKATLDESMLWHRRLGHINFKNINKLVKDNLVHKENLMQDVGHGEPKSTADDQKQVEDGPDNENDEKDKSEDDSSPKEVNTTGQHANTASPEFNIGSFKLNTIEPSINTASSYDPDSPKDMFKMGASHTIEATHVELFSDKDEPEVDLGNILNSYIVPTTLNTRIHKDHPIKNVIGDVKSSVQTRRITKHTFEQGLNPQALLKLYLIHLGWKQCGKNFYNSNSNRFGYLWICLLGRGPLEQNRSSETRKLKEGLQLGIKQGNKIVLAYASSMGFLVYQMDVKSALLYGTIKEEVYVTQLPGFKDLDNPDKVYKVVKALYGLHQALRAWYETLANYLLGNGFKREKIDQTLFIKKQKGDILLVQVYVDDIIFGSTNMELCTGFEKHMKDKFQISSMVELTFFLGLQLTQKEDRIFISQDKYVAKILKKLNYTDVKSASTPVDLEKPLVKDGDADDVDVHLYRYMIGSLMYLTSSRPDIMSALCACARFQVTLKTSYLLVVRRIFRYLKGKPTLGL
ncbi:putative ribonuclease H-like domain-containing protein [Tanacetum coccineum]